MNYTRAQLINALVAEWEYLCHDDFDPEEDQTPEEYREELQDYTLDQLIEETSTGEGYTLDEWMENWGGISNCNSLKCPSCMMTTETMTPEQQYQQLFEQMYQLCEDNEWGDPFSYARSREIHMAGVLGHTIADDYSGSSMLSMKMAAQNINRPLANLSMQRIMVLVFKILGKSKNVI